MNAGDVAKVRALVALPLAWGKACEPILTREALEKTLARELAGGTNQAKEPDLVKELHGKWDAHDESLAAPFERLAGVERACPSLPLPLPPPALEAQRARRHRYYLADNLLTRLSLIDGAWRVTGWSGASDQ